MSCFRPLEAWRSLSSLTEGGKAVIRFNRPSGPAEAVRVPCGQCVGCRLDKSREWALRCIHESQCHAENAYVTLTYRPEDLPEGGTLVKEHHQRFMKDLRAFYEGRRIRFFMCGEYGDKDMRPHFHYLLFGVDFVDKEFIGKSHSGEDMYVSEELQSSWKRGFSTVQDLTWQSAAYVARYSLKKVNGEKAYERYCRDIDVDTGECRMLEPEFVCMSRMPGIGFEWFQQFKDDCRKGFLTAELGKRYPVPAYYLRLLERDDKAEYERLKRLRKERAKAGVLPRRRLAALEHHKVCQTKRLKRSV